MLDIALGGRKPAVGAWTGVPICLPRGCLRKGGHETAKTTCKASTDGTIHYQECIHKLFEDLFKNPVISGLTVGERWDNIQVSSHGLSSLHQLRACYLDQYGLGLPGRRVQRSQRARQDRGTDHYSRRGYAALGFGAIPILRRTLSSLYSSRGIDCGKVTIEHFQQEQRADSHILPLPWNEVYQVSLEQFPLACQRQIQQRP